MRIYVFMKEKKEKKRSWYKRGGYKSVIFVPATPDSQLKKELEQDINESGVKIKVAERAGTSMKRILQRSNPFKRKTCGREDCLVCSTGGKGPCDAPGVTYEVYEVKCVDCGHKYIGETARSVYTLGKEHLKAIDQGDQQAALVRRHSRERHQDVIPDFIVNVTAVSFKGRDAMLSRQISESVRISREKPEELINNKTEWNYVHIPRASFSR